MGGDICHGDIGGSRTRRCLRHNTLAVFRPLALLGGAAVGFHAHIVCGGACQSRNGVRMACGGHLCPGGGGVHSVGHRPLGLAAGRGPVDCKAVVRDVGNHDACGLRTSERCGEGVVERGLACRVGDRVAKGFHIDAVRGAFRQVGKGIRTLSILHHRPAGGGSTLVVEVPVGGVARFGPIHHCRVGGDVIGVHVDRRGTIHKVYGDVVDSGGRVVVYAAVVMPHKVETLDASRGAAGQDGGVHLVSAALVQFTRNGGGTSGHYQRRAGSGSGGVAQIDFHIVQGRFTQTVPVERELIPIGAGGEIDVAICPHIAGR